jgi:hypothetical protein
VNIAQGATKGPAPHLHETSQAPADYSQEASTDPTSTSQEASARPTDARDDDRKTSCDHPMTVSLAVESSYPSFCHFTPLKQTLI